MSTLFVFKKNKKIFHSIFYLQEPYQTRTQHVFKCVNESERYSKFSIYQLYVIRAHIQKILLCLVDC